RRAPRIARAAASWLDFDESRQAARRRTLWRNVNMSTIESVSTENSVFDPPADFVAQATVKQADFDALNASAAKDFAGFWAKLARDEVLWKKPFTRTLDESNAPFYKWFDDGLLNVSYNCLHRTLQNGNAEKVAIIFEADDGAVTKVTYRELYHRVCRLANGGQSLGHKKSDHGGLSLTVVKQAS